MKIVLEAIRESDRSGNPPPCWLCRRRFVVGPVAAWAYSDYGEIDCGPLCPMCIEEGPERMNKRLEQEAYEAREVAEDAELLAAEGVTEAPSIEELQANAADAEARDQT